MQMDSPSQSESAAKKAAALWRKARQCFAHFLTMLLLGLLLQHFDPFGFLNYTEKKTLDFFNFVLGPELPSTWNEEFSVVLIDDVYVEKYSEWPLPYNEHAQALRKILLFEPRAVFLDLLFINDKNARTILPLLLVLKQYRDRGIHVFATVPEVKSELIPKLVELIHPVTTRLERDETTYRDYKLHRDNQFSPTAPAAVLVAEYCSRTPTNTKRYEIWSEACGRFEDGHPFDKDSPEMMLLWGTQHAEANKVAFECNALVGDGWQGQLKNLIVLDRKQRLQKCPRYPTVLLDNLLGGFPDEKLSEYLSDKIIFYGPEIEGATVWTTPPTHDSLSSTYTHATALENLLIFGDRYFAADRTIGPLSVRTLFEYTLWIILCFLVSFRIFGLHPIAPKKHHSFGYLFLFDLCSYTLLCAFAFFLTGLQSYTFKVAPINFLGILSLVLAITSVQESKYFGILESFFSKLLRLDPFALPSTEQKNP